MADYTLSAKVTADISSLEKSFKSAQDSAKSLQKSLDSLDTGSSFKNLGSSLDSVGSKISSVGDSISAVSDKVSSIGDSMTAMFTAPIAAGLTSIVSATADIEQSIGGVETLFKDSAGTVIANAKQAFSTVGISANQYMEQVTSFSASLLQSLGGDTAKAASYADRAMKDMADNANKFGTDMESIQYAYQGFAKQNYTMLDNLKLGYGGTKEEMQRLIADASKMTGIQEQLGVTVDGTSMSFGNIVNAISVMQQSLGIAGTTAKEASTTIWGSFNQMKAAAIDFAATFGQANTDTDTAFNNMYQSAVTFANNVKAVLKNVWDNLPLAEYQKTLIATVAVAGPVLSILGRIGGAIGNITEGFGDLLKHIGSLASGFGGLVSDAGGLLPLLSQMAVPLLIIAGVAVGIMALVEAFKQLYSSSESFRNSVATLNDTISGAFQQIMTAIQPMIEPLTEMFSSIFEAIVSLFTTLLPIIIPIITNIITVVADVITTIINIVTPIITIVSGIIQAMVDVISPIINGILQVFASVIEGVTGLWSAWASTVGGIIGKVTGVVQDVASKIKDFFKGAFDAVAGWASSIFGGIANTITSAFSGAMSGVKGIINTVINGMNGATGIMNKIPGVSIPKIPNLLRGTDNWAGGFARMNEGGRGELTYLPSGTVVVPHDISMKYAKEAGRSNNVVAISNGNDTSTILSAIKSIADRPNVFNVNGRRFAVATADDYSTVNQRNDMIVNRMRGGL
jgi:phage-related protein